MGSAKRLTAEVILQTQSTLVFPGRSLRGEVVLNTERNLEMKSAQVIFTCVEETHIRTRIPFISSDNEENPPSPLGRLSGAYDRSVITARTLTLSGGETVSPPRATFPFELKVPSDALPSYSGRSATVGCWLEAKVVPVVESEIVTTREVTVLPLAQRPPTRLVLANEPSAVVGLELEILQDVVEPGGEVKGVLTVTRLKAKPQKISVRLMAHEFAKGRQTVGFQIDTRDVSLASMDLFDRWRLEPGRSERFALRVPEGVVTYAGQNSSSRLLVKATAALRFRRDISLTAQIHVGRHAQGQDGGYDWSAEGKKAGALKRSFL